MRVKTVPRQRVTQGSRNIESVLEIITGAIVNPGQSSASDGEENMSEGESDAFHGSTERAVDSLNANQSEDRSANEGKRKEELNYSEEALDMSVKYKVGIPEKKLSSFAPSCCNYADSCATDETKVLIRNDGNNNILMPTAYAGYRCPITAPSSIGNVKSSESKSTTCSSDNDKSVEAVDLCKKDCNGQDVSNPSGGSGERLKDTVLYKIMTDPTFLENIQKSKQSKKHICKFCRQEFASSDELADHTDVKKDESNRVVCCACKKAYAQKRYLRYHQRCRCKRTKFTYDISTKKYTQMDNLSRHNAVHVNPDKSSCTYCERTFARKDPLNKYLKGHDNMYRFFCETCQKYFEGPLTLDSRRKNFHSMS